MNGQAPKNRTSTPLQVVSEREILDSAPPEALRANQSFDPGVWAVVAPMRVIAPEVLAARVAGRIGGAPRPAWAEPTTAAIQGEVVVARARDVILAPRAGVLIDRAGRVFQSTAGEMLSWKADLAALPGVRAEGDVRLFAPPADLPALGAASVFFAKGGAFNYGHLLLDCLPALLAIERQGMLDRFPPVAGPLRRWQRDLLALAFPGLAVRELRAPLVRLEEAAFASPMDHFLHRPNLILARLRERILANASPPKAVRRLYVSRRAYPMRVMVNEAALEAALEARGFTIVRPERLPVAEQIALLRGADVVVGATGAGLANGLFAPDGGKVFEIQPEGFTAPWLRDVLHIAGVHWHGYFCPAPVDPREVAWSYRIRRGFRWGYRLPLDDFLRFLDARL